MAYLLGEVLYTGSETRIVHGTHSKSGARVALKLPCEEVPAPRTLEKLRHEHAMLCALDVPGVIRAIGIEPYGPGLSLVLEDWGDMSLSRLLTQGPLPVEAALRLGARVARALGQVHRRGVIHRDVKPQNILVDAACSDIRLIDFGIATRETQPIEVVTAAEALAGTLAYMAPEQTGRMNRAIDARADLYALGATLYQMLTGELPFALSDALELIHAHIAKKPRPPHARAPERRIPEAVSAIVLKLMEKSPEDRYQTADGAAFDLERAARGWAETGAVVPFDLATRDWEDRIRKPSRLFGRERELSALAAAFAAACGGAAVFARVAGPSGVGKSALVLSLREMVRERRGLFASGKFDQLQRSEPYSALSQALRSVVRRRLGDRADLLARWTQAFQQAAEPNGRILVDLIPELVHFLGQPRPLIEVGPLETQNRFQRTVLRFVQSLATAEHPLFMLIDDLQWADPASLRLLQALLTDPSSGHLLLLGAYRDDDALALQPLLGLASAVQSSGGGGPELTLSPLDEAALRAMVANMLQRPAAEVEELARLVKEKTGGSPFFMVQFLQTLHEQRLLRREPETGAWQLQREAIERAGITDNVAALLTRRLEELSPALRTALQTAACVGHRFKPELVAVVAGQRVEALSAMLDEAEREGLLLREGDPGREAFTFVHDRVQQAAYEARALEERLTTHLAIGRTLRARALAAGADDELFVTLHHRNLASALLTDAAEKRDLAEQNLAAGQRAKTSTAYSEAVGFLKVGQALVGEAGWDEALELTFETHLCMAEAASLAGQSEEGARLFQRCIERAQDPLERARAVSVWMPLLSIAGQGAQGVELGLSALAWLGRPLPRAAEEHRALLGQMLQELEPVLERMTLEDWRALPISADRTHALVCKLSCLLGVCAIGAQPSLSPCCFMMIVPETLRHGLTRDSLSGCAPTALFLGYGLGKLKPARRLLEAVLELLERYDATRSMALNAAAIASPYWTPLGRAREIFLRTERAGAEEGSISVEAQGSVQSLYVDVLSGAYLPAVTEAARGRRYRDVTSVGFQRSLLEALDALQQSSAGEEGDDDALLALLATRQCAPGSTVFPFFSGGMVSFARLHLGADERAARMAVAAEPLWPTSWGAPALLALTLTLCVALGHCLPAASAEERAAWEEKLAFHAGRLALWAESCPETFLHMRLLLDAGTARLAGKHDEANRLYDEAIADAHQNGFVNDAALGLRLAGEHHLARGKSILARAYLREAQDAYLRWGALGAAARIRARHPDVFPVVARRAGEEPATPVEVADKLTPSMTTSERQINPRLDTASVLRAAQALAGDRDLGSLLGRMLRLMAENAGAERAVLVLARSGELSVRAQLTVNPEQVEINLDEPIDGSARLPSTLVQYVARDLSPLVLGQATFDSRFDEDPYLRAHRPASVLAVPLVHQGRLSGVMYLEHPRAQDAFPEARVELTTLLASQAATAVENTMLVADLAASNERLEQQVQERTSELKAAKDMADAANQAKSDFLSSMSHELRTPLSGILGYAQILERLPDMPSRGRDGARIIHRSGKHLLKLINDSLDLAKIEAGKMDLIQSDVHFPSVVQTVAHLCRVSAEQKNIAFTYEHVGPDLVEVRADEKRLTQVLLNLVGNAIKFTAQGGVTLRSVALGERRDEGRTVRFEVEDTGPGIAPEHLGRIFKPFEQAGDQRTRAAGTGLGLWITRKIIEQMGGSLSVQSKLGEGSVFTVTLRLCEVAAGASASAEPAGEEIAGDAGERRTMLLVDSDQGRGKAIATPLLGEVAVTGLAPPPAPDFLRLLNLAERGRRRNLLDELRRLEEEAPHLGPWIGQVRVLAQAGQTRELLEFLRAQTDAVA